MRLKYDVYDIFSSFKKQVEKYTSRAIKMLRTDGGAEYTNTRFKSLLQAHGIAHQISCPYTPEQNGVAERKHRHIIETSLTLLNNASIPYDHWPEAVLTSVFLINRMPSIHSNKISPFEIFHKIQPQYDHLRTFGCKCFPLLPPTNCHKFQNKSTSCVFLGYSDTYKGYKCLDISNNKIYISRNTTFNENSFPFKIPSDTITTQTSDVIPLLLQPVSVAQHSILPQKSDPSKLHDKLTVSSIYIPTDSEPQQPVSTISSQPVHASSAPQPHISHPMITRHKSGSLKPRIRLNLLHSKLPTEHNTTPTNYTEAVKQPEWRNAMANEFLALQKQGTWSLVKPPNQFTILGCKWTYRLKHHEDGTIAKYKARLVAQGNTQEYGLDYTETFSPDVKLPTIRIMLTIALHHDWQVHQLDVANAFLHGTLSEIVYMTQPRGFEDSMYPDYVCCLHKAIYGLKQAPRQWYNTFTSFLVSIGFYHSNAVLR
ncbi:hypothetical protein KFK09_007474 [Dendrobium nobile]|uniref:Integrase catalytic domain-containing protein n=1 Tax=Dendrobium nobile TaxID=94219 RepID=A0A8T3BUF9_DENNO|nr:hypothetical protein KFK09_007474 [Dendrobium nobile]